MLKNTNSLGIIPARFSSTRFPGKPLVEISGKSMVMRVYEQASKAIGLSALVVATDDERILEHVLSFGGQVVLTSPNHSSGTDRCAEVVQLPQFQNFDFVLNIQGDEPFINPIQIDECLNILLRNEQAAISTLAKKIETLEELLSPNTVKLVMGNENQALYFSRAAIPFLRDIPQANWLEKGTFYKHPGLYGFRRDALLKLATLPAGNLEIAESLEQLRWLENGFRIGVELTQWDSIAVDTPADLERLIQSSILSKEEW